MTAGVSKVIIGFRLNLVDLDDLRRFPTSEAVAENALRSAPPPGFSGYLGVARRLSYLNAVVALVETSQLAEFIREAVSFDPVEYCDKNVRLRTLSYGSSLPEQYRLGQDIADVLVQCHLGTPDNGEPFGLGTRIGLIDSGISPHPLLPALCGEELVLKRSTMHEFIPRATRPSLCSRVQDVQRRAGVEGVGILASKNGSGIAASSPPSSLHLELQHFLDQYVESLWDDWRKEVGTWFARHRQGARPKLPAYRNVIGSMRLISPLSRSFLEDELAQDILDADGHGTQMAGILSALRPGMRQVTPLGQLSKASNLPLIYDVAGLCPYAELVVLKCFHQLDEDDEECVKGGLVSLVDALVYAIDHKIDILYIGLALVDGGFNVPVSAANLLNKLANQGTIVVAPAGNDGNQSELAFPAAFDSVRAVTSVRWDKKTLRLDLSPHSSIAKRRQHKEVSYCAYGGEEDDRIVTLGKDSGFAAVWGTSVAAAIATGCLASNASKLYASRVQREYDLHMQSGNISPMDVQMAITGWQESDVDRTSLAQRIKAGCHPVNTTSQWNPVDCFGAGIIRVLPPTSMP